jgi:hypothetical protein
MVLCAEEQHGSNRQGNKETKGGRPAGRRSLSIIELLFRSFGGSFRILSFAHAPGRFILMADDGEAADAGGERRDFKRAHASYHYSSCLEVSTASVANEMHLYAVVQECTAPRTTRSNGALSSGRSSLAPRS